MYLLLKSKSYFLAVMGKWTKLGKSVIEKYKCVLSLPRILKTINNFFVTEMCQKNVEILVDSVFFLFEK